jgi:ketosteroid isomerase-like protein
MSDKPAVTLTDMQRFLDCFNRHDVDGILGFFAEDGVYETPRGPDVVGKRLAGKEAIGAYFAKMFQRVPDTHFGEDAHWLSADGARGVSEWVLSGTNPDGTKMRMRGCDHFRFRGDKIVLKDSYLKQVQEGVWHGETKQAAD